MLYCIQYSAFICSAFYDNRLSLEHNKVRITGIAEEMVRILYCLMWKKGEITSTAAVATRSVVLNDGLMHFLFCFA